MTSATDSERLQELVRHMIVCIDHMARGFSDGDMRCYECPYDNDEQRCDFERRARELLVEVDA